MNTDKPDKRKYQFSCTVVIPEWFNVEPSDFTIQSVQTPCDNGEFFISLSLNEQQHLQIFVNGTIEIEIEKYMLKYSPHDVEFVAVKSYFGSSLGSYIYWSLWPILVRLSYVAGNPNLLHRYNWTPIEKLLGDIVVKPDGMEEFITRTNLSLGRFLGLGFLSMPIIPVGNVKRVLERKTFDFENFAVLADERWCAFDDKSAIVWLATTLEVASYEFLGKNPKFKEIDFHPTHYLGNEFSKRTKSESFRCYCKIKDLPYYKDCQELWGTRNEVVHNGRFMIREYDPEEDKTDKKKLRNGELSSTVWTFREVVYQAIEWLKLQPSKLSGK